MFKRLCLIAVLLVVTVLGSFVANNAAPAEAAINCDVLHVSATVAVLGLSNPVYRVNGSGPGLPSEGVAVTPTINISQIIYNDISWAIYGPGSWDGLFLEYSESGSNVWHTSVSSPVASCSAVGCDANVYIPSTAVGGTITDNAAVFQMPDPNTMTNIVLEVGKTFWMDGLDASGMYRKVLISCEWVWVEAAKTGPNYDDVWNGTPLPGNTVD